MGNVLIIAEHRGGEIAAGTFNAITFGRAAAEKQGGELHLAVLGADPMGPAEKLAGYGAKVHAVAHAALSDYLAGPFAEALAQLVDQVDATLVGAAATTFGKDLMPRLAARLDAAMASEILAQVDPAVFKQPMWAGNAIAEVELLTERRVVTVRATEFEAAQPGGEGGVESFSPEIDAAGFKVEFASFDEVTSERPALTEARVVVSGGRGCKTREQFEDIIGKLADKLGAAVGATRAVVDAGWVPNDLQVGQTGKIVAPDLYIAVGLSGAIQHVAGMKGAKTIVAINTDPEADIFKVADYGLEADLFKAVPELVELL